MGRWRGREVGGGILWRRGPVEVLQQESWCPQQLTDWEKIKKMCREVPGRYIYI
jgi:hypothetical protein